MLSLSKDYSSSLLCSVFFKMRVSFGSISLSNSSMSHFGLSTPITMMLLRLSFWWRSIDVSSWSCGVWVDTSRQEQSGSQGDSVLQRLLKPLQLQKGLVLSGISC